MTKQEKTEQLLQLLITVWLQAKLQEAKRDFGPIAKQMGIDLGNDTEGRKLILSLLKTSAVTLETML